MDIYYRCKKPHGILCEKLYSKSQGFLDEHLSYNSDSLVDLRFACTWKHDADGINKSKVKNPYTKDPSSH